MYGSLQQELGGARRAQRGGALQGRARARVAAVGARRVEGMGGLLNLCANNYLGLADHPERDRGGAATRSSAGASGWRRCGSSAARRRCTSELEERLSAFLGTEDTILFSLVLRRQRRPVRGAARSEQDAVISDALNHASIIDGIRLCKATPAALRERRHGRARGAPRRGRRRPLPADRDRRRLLDGRLHRQARPGSATSPTATARW